MRSNRNHVWFGALCALVLTGQMAVRAADDKQEGAKPDDKPVTLAQSVKVGDKVRYKNSLVVSTGGGEVKVETSAKQTVKEIKDNKDVVILLEDEGTKVDAGGMEQEFPGDPPVTLTLDKNGKILSFKPKEEATSIFSTSTNHLITLVDRIVFPDKPVKPGDSWTTELDNPAFKDKKDKKVKLKTTYVGMGKVGDVAAWKVKQTLEADTEGESKMSSEATALLDTTNGQLIEADLTVKGVPSQMGAMEWKAKLKRVKLEPEKKSAAP